MGLEGLRQHLYNIKKFHALRLYPVSNQKAHHGWAQSKIFNITVFRQEDAILGAL